MPRSSYLIYTSVIAEGSASEHDLMMRDILKRSRANNQRLDITGALLAHHGAFAQILEGGLDEITAMYRTICADVRHFDQRLMIMEPLEKRRFGSWAMCICKPQDQPIDDRLSVRRLSIPDLVDLMEASISEA